jgi:hypothetical protein
MIGAASGAKLCLQSLPRAPERAVDFGRALSGIKRISEAVAAQIAAAEDLRANTVFSYLLELLAMAAKREESGLLSPAEYRQIECRSMRLLRALCGSSNAKGRK